MRSSSGEEAVCRSSPRKERVITMVTFLLPQSRVAEVIMDFLPAGEDKVCPSSPNNDRSIAMANVFPSLVEFVEEVRAYLLEKRRPTLLAPGRKGVCPSPSSSFPQWRVVDVVKAYLLEKRRPAVRVLGRKGVCP